VLSASSVKICKGLIASKQARKGEIMEMVEDKKMNPEIMSDTTIDAAAAAKLQSTLEFCCDKENCLSLDDILRSFNAPLSEEQAWALIYQSVLFYRNFIHLEFIDKNTRKDSHKTSHRIKVPKSPKNLNVHKDGTVHINDKSEYQRNSSSKS
jgi:spire-like protein